MATEEVGEEEIRVIVSKGHLAVEMMVPAGFPRESLTKEMCLGLLQQSGVDLTDPLVASVETMIANPSPSGEDQRTQLAKAILPQTGEDGYLKWLVAEPTAGQNEEDNDDDKENDEVSYYHRSAYIVVKTGDVIGQFITPTDGVDGRDVLGQTIAAKPGKPVGLKIDESIVRDPSGELIVQIDGVLYRDDESASVRQLLEVPEYVDFSSGNIDFIGNVLVRQGVRDCFVVEATGSIEVKGLIEAATIKCGTDLVARGGMAGRERGYITVGGNFSGKYLDNIQGQIRGDMDLDREAINCELTIHGSIQSPRGTIIGGKIIVTGSVEVSAVGSGAGVATELVLGSVPRLEPFMAQLEKLIDQLTAQRDSIEAEQKLMKKNTRMMTASDKERQTEILFEHQLAVTKIAEGIAAQEALAMRIKQYRTVDLLIHRKLFPGVLVTIGHQSYKIRNELRGPVKIILDANNNVVYSAGSASGSLSKIAELKAAAA